VAGGPKNTWWMNLSEYATLKMPARVAAAGKPMRRAADWPTKIVSAKNISFDRKPLRRGTPAMAAAATIASVAVIGIARARPLRRLRSRVPDS
jgi:hypothetical protein